MIDIELFYCSLGYMETPPKPPQFGVNCNFSWEHTFIPGNYGSSEIEEIPNLISHVCIVVRFIITTLTVLTILLIWWYTGHPVQTAIIICIIFLIFFFWLKYEIFRPWIRIREKTFGRSSSFMSRNKYSVLAIGIAICFWNICLWLRGF